MDPALTSKSDYPPRVLLVGATGQVGRELLRALAVVGPVFATARPPGAFAGTAHPRILDVTDLDAVRRTVREVRPAIIVNAAAYTAVDRAESETDLAMLVNGIMPGVLAEEARAIGAALVHYSTDYVFDGSGTRPWREDDATNPLNVYGRTKLAGEMAIRAAGAAHIILRISWIYAAHGHNFVRTMLKLASERMELRVVADQVGGPTPAAVVAAATAEILRLAGGSPDEFFRERGGTFHLPVAGETSWHGFAEEIFRLARAAGLSLRVERVLPIATAEYQTSARRPLNSRLDGGRVRERFNIALPDWWAALATEFPAIVQGLR
jgi:dTDP-4-dehydrorhamnose reductase